MLEALKVFPPIEGDFTCINALQSMGNAKAGYMSLVPIDPPHIESWMRITGRHLTPWECETVLMLSEAYCSQARISSDDCDPPYLPPIDQKAHAKMLRNKMKGIVPKR